MSYEISRGESRDIEHTVRDDADALVDLTAAEITFTVYGLDGETVLTLRSVAAGGSTDEIEIPDQEANDAADLGKFTLKLTSANTDLEQTARWADCWVTTAAEPPETLKVVDHAAFHVTGNAIPA